MVTRGSNKQKPLLILVSGPPGVGKSTLARGLLATIGGTLLDKDAVDEPFSPNDRGELYTRDIEPKVLGALLNLAELNLIHGAMVFLDVPWTHILLNSPEWKKSILRLLKRKRAELLVLECALDEERHRFRIKKRGLKRDRVKMSVQGWARFKKTDRIGEKNPFPHVLVDMRMSKNRCLKQALALIHSLNRGFSTRSVPAVVAKKK